MTEPVRAPEPIASHHDSTAFASGEESLDRWLMQWAVRAEETGSARTYVACADDRVVAFYSLAMASIRRDDVPRKLRMSHGMPVELPVVLLARLAVDTSAQGTGVGGRMLRHALRTSVKTAATIGCVAVIVDAISEPAKTFYQRYDFVETRFDPMRLLLPMRVIAEDLLEETPADR